MKVINHHRLCLLLLAGLLCLTSPDGPVWLTPSQIVLFRAATPSECILPQATFIKTADGKFVCVTEKPEQVAQELEHL